MKKRQIVNIINFIRAVEPRLEMDLVTPVAEQIRLLKQYNLKGTFLLQYDALIDEVYVNLLKDLDKTQFELGVWFETVQPLVEKAGLVWRGRYPWDWHSHCGFSVGYTREEREKLIDVLFGDFKKTFGYYPKSFGSWAFDAHTLGYATEKYGLFAACNCKEQWGTDGYTLWGGYYGQGYYPNKRNVIAPAQTAENQIPTPVFRMLGSDPIYQYDCGLDLNAGFSSAQGVITLEPVYTGKSGGGGVNSWVDWYLAENFNGKCLSFGYTQAGQENSFGWRAMQKGLEYQFIKISEMRNAGQVEVETLGETGTWYKNTYEVTPPSAITALTDWKNENRKSVWYSCKNYRINIYSENGEIWIRDLHLFRDGYTERYLFDTYKANDMTYDNLPVVDGNRFSGGGTRSGVWFERDGKRLAVTDISYAETDGNAVIACKSDGGDFSLTLTEKGVKIAGESITLKPCYDARISKWLKISNVETDEIEFVYNGYKYKIRVENAEISDVYIVVCNKSGIANDNAFINLSV